MSIPSITIRLDFGDGDASSGSVQQRSAPTPIDLASLGVAAANDGAPTPTSDPIGLGMAAAGAPPEPSSDVPGLGQGAAGDGAEENIPHPEGDPSEKKTGRK